MKKLFFTAALSGMAFCAFSQTEKLESVARRMEDKVIRLDRTAHNTIINDQNVTISGWLNEGADDLKLKVDAITYKKYEDTSDDLFSWYYCTSTTKEPIVGFAKYVLVIPVTKDKIEVYRYAANEVDVTHTTMLVKNIVKM
jgi:hypothetical protein